MSEANKAERCDYNVSNRLSQLDTALEVAEMERHDADEDEEKNE